MIRFVLSMTALCLAGFAVVFITTYPMAYTAGYNRGYGTGLLGNDTSTCHLSNVQAQWAMHVRDDMLKSRHYTQAEADQILYEIAAAYGFPCGGPMIPGNLYDPRAKASPIPLGKPTLPIGNHITYKRIPDDINK